MRGILSRYTTRTRTRARKNTSTRAHTHAHTQHRRTLAEMTGLKGRIKIDGRQRRHAAQRTRADRRGQELRAAGGGKGNLNSDAGRTRGKTHALLFCPRDSIAGNLERHTLQLHLPPPAEFYILWGSRIIQVDLTGAENGFFREPLLRILL